MIKAKTRTTTHKAVVTSATRDAVETAIDSAKSNKTSTWEDSAAKSSGKISRWHIKMVSKAAPTKTS